MDVKSSDSLILSLLENYLLSSCSFSLAFNKSWSLPSNYKILLCSIKSYSSFSFIFFSASYLSFCSLFNFYIVLLSCFIKSLFFYLSLKSKSYNSFDFEIVCNVLASWSWIDLFSSASFDKMSLFNFVI